MTGAEEAEITPELATDRRRLDRTRRFGRNLLAITVGLGVTTGATYLGYKTGIELAGHGENSNFIDYTNYYGSIVMPTVVYGGLGLAGGFYATVAVAGENQPIQNPTPKQASADSVTSPEPTA